MKFILNFFFLVLLYYTIELLILMSKYISDS